MNRHLPSCIFENAEIQKLTDRQISSLLSRFDRIDDIVEQIRDWTRRNDARSTKEFLDSVEVDLVISQNLPEENPEEAISSYIVHSSWTFSIEASELGDALPDATIRAIDMAVPSINSDEAVFRNWIVALAEALDSECEQFFSSKLFREVVAHFIAIDILLANLLLGVYKVRLNKKLIL